MKCFTLVLLVGLAAARPQGYDYPSYDTAGSSGVASAPVQPSVYSDYGSVAQTQPEGIPAVAAPAPVYPIAPSYEDEAGITTEVPSEYYRKAREAYDPSVYGDPTTQYPAQDDTTVSYRKAREADDEDELKDWDDSHKTRDDDDDDFHRTYDSAVSSDEGAITTVQSIVTTGGY